MKSTTGKASAAPAGGEPAGVGLVQDLHVGPLVDLGEIVPGRHRVRLTRRMMSSTTTWPPASAAICTA